MHENRATERDVVRASRIVEWENAFPSCFFLSGP